MKDAWKNKEVFNRQLALNKRELNNEYPPHWIIFLKAYQTFKPSKVLDLGCGAGVYYELFKRHFPEIDYWGADYSEDAINLARKTWGSEERFFVKDFWDFTTEEVKSYDNILIGAVLDVMPDGDEAFDFLLSLQPNSVFIQRMEITDKPSHKTVYEAYDQITTCQYHHNYKQVNNILDKYQYEAVSLDPSNHYIKRKTDEVAK